MMKVYNQGNKGCFSEIVAYLKFLRSYELKW